MTDVERTPEFFEPDESPTVPTKPGYRLTCLHLETSIRGATDGKTIHDTAEVARRQATVLQDAFDLAHSEFSIDRVYFSVEEVRVPITRLAEGQTIRVIRDVYAQEVDDADNGDTVFDEKVFLYQREIGIIQHRVRGFKAYIVDFAGNLGTLVVHEDWIEPC